MLDSEFEATLRSDGRPKMRRVVQGRPQRVLNVEIDADLYERLVAESKGSMSLAKAVSGIIATHFRRMDRSKKKRNATSTKISA